MQGCIYLKTYKILIIEDEIIPANYIKKILERGGHTIIGIAQSKEEALSYLDSQNYPELILMDIKLKGEDDGIQIAKIFQKQIHVAILYLSAYSDDTLLSRANGTCPIGYLVKPVQEQTLLSTIFIGMANFTKETLEERIMLTTSASFDPKEQVVHENEKTIILTKHESLLLAILVKHPNQLISYTLLENSIWLGETLSDSMLRTTVWRLRKKLPKDIQINNIYSTGYKISF